MDQDQHSDGITEREAAARIFAKGRPPEAPLNPGLPQQAPRGADGRFQAQPAREPEHPDPTPDPDPDAAPDAQPEDALGDEDIEIDTGLEAEPSQAPSLKMPASYGTSAEEIWNSFTPEQQKFLHQHDSKRTSGLSRQANELKAAEAKAKSDADALEQQRLQLAQAARRYQSEAEKRFLAKFGDVKDPATLAATDKARWIEYQAALMEANAAANEAHAWQMAIDQDRVKQINDFRAAENQKLIERLGLDDEKGAAFQDRIVKFAEPLGVNMNRLSQYTAEEILMVEDARKWRAAVARSKQSAVQAAKAAPKVIRPGTPTSTSALRMDSVQSAKSQLKKTGRLEDAAKLFSARAKAAR